VTQAAQAGPRAPERALRVDAERRRQALLCAAASVFADHGLDAPLEDVARAAGVGIATLYRRFPTRDALVEAVFDAKMLRYAERAEAAVAQAAHEPGPAFAGFVRGVAAMQAADPAFAAVLLRPRQGSQLFAETHDRARRAARSLVARARDAGVVRPDVTETDLYLLATATAAVVGEQCPVPARRAARRMVELFLDAVCRNTDAGPLPPALPNQPIEGSRDAMTTVITGAVVETPRRLA
jgi:AcrR family transcriptional regulator